MGKVDVPEWADYDLGTNQERQAGRACDQVVRERTEEAGRKLQGLHTHVCRWLETQWREVSRDQC